MDLGREIAPDLCAEAVLGIDVRRLSETTAPVPCRGVSCTRGKLSRRRCEQALSNKLLCENLRLDAPLCCAGVRSSRLRRVIQMGDQKAKRAHDESNHQRGYDLFKKMQGLFNRRPAIRTPFRSAAYIAKAFATLNNCHHVPFPSARSLTAAQNICFFDNRESGLLVPPHFVWGEPLDVSHAALSASRRAARIAGRTAQGGRFDSGAAC